MIRISRSQCPVCPSQGKWQMVVREDSLWKPVGTERYKVSGIGPILPTKERPCKERSVDMPVFTTPAQNTQTDHYLLEIIQENCRHVQTFSSCSCKTCARVSASAVSITELVFMTARAKRVGFKPTKSEGNTPASKCTCNYRLWSWVGIGRASWMEDWACKPKVK